MFNYVYKDKTVFLTGHTGFKGSWMTVWLKSLGARIVGYSLEPQTQPNLFDTVDVSDGITHIIGDIRDYDNLVSVMRSCKPDMVFHMAAQPLVGRSYQDPRATYEVNVMGTVNILNAVRHTDSVRVCVNVTSDKCYDNRGSIYAYRESDPMGGYDPYSASKGCAELVASAFRRSFFNPNRYDDHRVSLVSVRAGNVIGGGDWADDRIVPDCVRALAGGEAVRLRNPKAVRPWQYVLEPLSGYLWLGALLFQNSTAFDYGWNFGPNGAKSVTVRELVESIIGFWGGGGVTIEAGNELTKFHEADCLRLDSTKAGVVLGWHQVYGLEETIRSTIEWYREFYKNKAFDAKGHTLSQIAAYSAKARKAGLAWTSYRERPEWLERR